jgi:uncharacterized protein YwqG
VPSDGQTGWQWGDAGLLYYSIRPRDLAAADFDGVWLIAESF